MAVIKSGASTDQLTIDPVSKAGRVTVYDTTGRAIQEQATYRAAGQVVATTSTASFAVMTGSATKTVKVRNVHVSGATATTLAVHSIQIKKYSTAPAGGAPANLTQVPVDSNQGAGTIGTLATSTTAFTDGTLVGVVASRRDILKSSTVVDGANFCEHDWNFGVTQEVRPITLRGTTQYIGLNFLAAPVTAVTLDVEVEWTEE